MENNTAFGIDTVKDMQIINFIGNVSGYYNYLSDNKEIRLQNKNNKLREKCLKTHDRSSYPNQRIYHFRV